MRAGSPAVATTLTAERSEAPAAQRAARSRFGRGREEAQPPCLERKALEKAAQLLAVAWQRVAQVNG